ncbi:WGR domain-containing protein [Paralimibaculum aggregatum]|uniref:WGR domain-containing protein n=1 Tax=Paralimibaculum aggregatum TaxID=3036245 RepID=UPI00331F7316
MRRFCRLALQPDLFGGCTLIREWGRIGRGGQMKREEFASEGQAVDALLAMDCRKA